MLVKVFRDCFIEMTSFLVLYLLLILAFTQFMYLLVYDRNSQFQSFTTSLITGFLIIIGNFNVDNFIHDAGYIFGSIVYCIFVVTIILVLVNMFITLLTDRYSRIRKSYKEDHHHEDSLFLTYIKQKMWQIRNKLIHFKSIVLQAKQV